MKLLLVCSAMLASVLGGCGGCGGDPGQSVFAVSCGQAGSVGSRTLVASGRGPEVVLLPNDANTITIEAQASSSSNFAVKAGADLLVNVIIGPGNTPTDFSGTYFVGPAARIEIVLGTGVAWSISATQPDTPGGGKLNKSGVGDAVFVLPARSARYTVSGRMPQGTENFVVKVGGRLVVNEIVGTEGYTTTFSAAPQEQVQVTNSPGVTWHFTEQ